MTPLAQIGQQWREVLTRVGRGEVSKQAGYERLASELQGLVAQCGYEESLAGYLTAGCHLSDEAYPESPLRGARFDASRLAVVEDNAIHIARGVAMYLAKAMAYARDEEQKGAKKIDRY